MSLKDVAKRIIHTFFAVWSLAGVTVSIVALASGWRVILVEFFVALFCIAVLTSLTYMVFYSKKELDIRALGIRLLVQYLLVMAIVITVSILAGWIYQGPIYVFTLVVSVTVIFITITVYEMYQTWSLAGVLNRKLREQFNEE